MQGKKETFVDVVNVCYWNFSDDFMLVYTC